MHLGLKQLAGFFDSHKHEDHLVLATVVATQGSTYRKPGAMMLITAEGSFVGLISGGCLEDDLVQHAMKVLEDGQPRRISYDLHDDEELIWGLGLGCGGDVHLLLQRLNRADGFGVLPGLFTSLSGGESCLLALVIESFGDKPVPGTAAMLDAAGNVFGALSLLPALKTHFNSSSTNGRCQEISLEMDGSSARVLLIRLTPSPRVLICGGGPDAVPVARQVTALGWDCTVVDHRPAYASAKRFPPEATVCCQRPSELSILVDLGRVDAAVVMSHHLEHDASYLEQLKSQGIAYIALLGPAARREQLLKRLGPGAPEIHGPAGLDIGAELPESIALSIMAEIHASLNGRSGLALSRDQHG